MRVLVLGGDGYLGWPTAMYLSSRDHHVAVCDNMIKRYWEAEVGISPLEEVPTLHTRIRRWQDLSGNAIKLFVGDIARNARFVYRMVEDFKPAALIHYAEQPSAPFSMIDRDKCVETQINNVTGTLNVLFSVRSVVPDCHIVKLGTMGEYGTPNIEIEEGWLHLEHNGRRDRVLFPKKPGSFYHLSKVHDSHNLEFACRVWGARATDLNQGIVYGVDTDETVIHSDLRTSFHYDAVFGTVLNRFVAQAVCGQPLTVYGRGGQTRGFLNIRDTLRCVELALNSTAAAGEFRVFNQFTEQFSVNELAEHVSRVGKARGLDVAVKQIDNPRIEMEDNYYSANHSALESLGLKPNLLTDNIVNHMFDYVTAAQDRIDPTVIAPSILWKQR